MFFSRDPRTLQVRAGALIVLQVLGLMFFYIPLLKFILYLAEPVIEEALKKAPADSVFLYVGVGDRSL